MRFLTLVRREIRENIGVFVVGLGLFLIGCPIIYDNADIYSTHSTDTMETVVKFSYYSPFEGVGVLLLFISCLSAAAMGIQQFCLPEFARTWAFLMHRYIKRSTIVLAKFLTTLLMLTVFIGGFWLLLYLYASKPGLYFLAPPLRMFWRGWYPVSLGFLLYLGTAITGLSMAKWYTTRLFGAASAFIIVLLLAFAVNLFWGVILLIIMCCIYGFTVLQMMEEKEF